MSATRRDAMWAVFAGEAVDRPPVSIRLDLWHNDLIASGRVPPEIAGLSQDQVEDYCGFARAARYRRSQPEIRYQSCEMRTMVRGDITRQEYVFPERVLIKETSRSPQMVRQGVRGHTLTYPLKERADYEVLLAHLDDAYLDCDLEGFSELDVTTGDRGLPMMILGPCPAHALMLGWTGYEQFYYHHADFPQTVGRLIEQWEQLYRRELWERLGHTSARLLLHGVHFSTQMTPPPIFDRYFMPYFSSFNHLAHAQGKTVLFHADAEMQGLASQVVEAGFDAADCLATAPMVSQELQDLFDIWQGQIVCWGGIPSTVFDPTFPIGEYEAYVRHLVGLVGDRKDFIFGASDNVMPGAEWQRLLFLAEVTGCHMAP